MIASISIGGGAFGPPPPLATPMTVCGRLEAVLLEEQKVLSRSPGQGNLVNEHSIAIT